MREKKMQKTPKIEARLRFGPTKKICPKCKSLRIDLHTGGILGKWKCNECDYQGAIVLEKD